MQDKTEESSILLRGEEVAALLGVSRAKAYRLMARREIPTVTFGKSVRCPRRALLALIENRTELQVGAAV